MYRNVRGRIEKGRNVNGTNSKGTNCKGTKCNWDEMWGTNSKGRNVMYRSERSPNIPFAMFLIAVRYCSIFEAYLNEREFLRMALLLNKYPSDLINDQFNSVLTKSGITEPLTTKSYYQVRNKVIQYTIPDKTPTDYEKTMFVYFSYCRNMQSFPIKFHRLWHKYFQQSPISELIPILGTENVDNLQKHLTCTTLLKKLELYRTPKKGSADVKKIGNMLKV